ncbi:phytanoyl-CoA dioxygenase family protein [Streptomyces albidoflavus]
MSLETLPSTENAAWELTDEEVDSFHRDGYLVLKGVIDKDQAETYRRHILKKVPADLTLPAAWQSRFGRIKPLQPNGEETFADPELLPLFQNERLYRAARRLLRTDRLRVFDGSLSITLRHDRGETPYSQRIHLDVRVPVEAAQFRLDLPETELAGCFYLTDVERNGGGIRLVPGGHRMVMEEAAAHPSGRQLHSKWTDIKGYPDPVEIVGEAGDFVLTHFLMPHTASHNRLTTTRVAQFLRWARHDHPYGLADPPEPDAYHAAQRSVLTPLGERLLGLAPWDADVH